MLDSVLRDKLLLYIYQKHNSNLHLSPSFLKASLLIPIECYKQFMRSTLSLSLFFLLFNRKSGIRQQAGRALNVYVCHIMAPMECAVAFNFQFPQKQFFRDFHRDRKGGRESISEPSESGENVRHHAWLLSQTIYLFIYTL